MVELNKDRLTKLESIELQRGVHPSVDKGMCAMEAAAWIAGEEHTDHPQCVSPVIAAFMRSWNDALDTATRQKLKPYVVRCIGTRASPEIEDRRAWLAADWLVRIYLPTWLDLIGLTQDADQIRALPEITSATVATSLPTLQAVQEKPFIAWPPVWAAVASAVNSVKTTAGAAAVVATWVAAWDATGVAAVAAAWDAAWNATKAAAAKTDATAGTALKPTVEKLQQSAFKLLDRMIECVTY